MNDTFSASQLPVALVALCISSDYKLSPYFAIDAMQQTCLVY